MVKKLIKYDFSSYLKLLLPVQLILLGIAAFNRIIQIFEDKSSTVYNIVFGSSVSLYVVSIIVALVLTFIVSIVRFYQGMYSNEGYLSHTLPVTPTQHIFSKLITTMLFYLGTIAAVILSFIIVTLGELNIEIMKSVGYLIGRFTTDTDGHFAFYLIEFIILLFCSSICTTLCIYFCISVGQLAQKRKILLAFGVYFGLYVLSQMFGTILIVVFSTISFTTRYNLTYWISQNIAAFFHIILIGGIVLELIMSLIYFLITRFIMSKKLNLA